MKASLYAVILTMLPACAWLLAGCMTSPTRSEAAADAKEPTVKNFRVGKVTYLTLTPDVGLKTTLAARGAGNVVLEYQIVEPVENRIYAQARKTVALRAGENEDQTTLSLNLNRMSGFLARVLVYAPGSHEILSQGERPFDVTNDLRTNFRYAGEVYPNVVKRLTPNRIGSGDTPDDFWDAMRIDVTPEECLEGLYNCYLNAANVSVDAGRGWYTCWANGNEFWTMSAYLQNDIWLLSHQKCLQLYYGGNDIGVLMEPWFDTRGIGQKYIDRKFPWLAADPSYYPGDYRMNLDPNYRRTLTEDEKKLSKVDLHGRDSWLGYIDEELFQMMDHYQAKAIWWDNSDGNHIDYVLTQFKDRWAKEKPNEPPPFLMVNGEAGIYSDTYWIEHNIPTRMEPYLADLDKLINERPAVKNGNATIFSGQHHPAKATGQQQGITDPENIYNHPDYPFIFRQLLFEAIAHDPKIVGQQQWPRSCLDWRIKTFTPAFRAHTRTWGFQTMMVHVYSQRDVAPYPLAGTVKILNYPATYGDQVEDGKLHLVARAPISEPDKIYLHLFNYTGTTTDIMKKRPHPTRLEDVRISLATPGFARNYRVTVYSPDFPNFGARLEPKVNYEPKTLEFPVPVENYSLIVLQKPFK